MNENKNICATCIHESCATAGDISACNMCAIGDGDPMLPVNWEQDNKETPH